MDKPILVVDDDPGVQELLRLMLEDEGYAVMLAGDGYVALEKLAAATPALIILDYMMPRMNGAAFVVAAEERGLRDSIPIVLLTAAGQAKERAKEIGTDGFMGKPFTIDEFLATVKRYVTH